QLLNDLTSNDPAKKQETERKLDEMRQQLEKQGAGKGLKEAQEQLAKNKGDKEAQEKIQQAAKEHMEQLLKDAAGKDADKREAAQRKLDEIGRQLKEEAKRQQFQKAVDDVTKGNLQPNLDKQSAEEDKTQSADQGAKKRQEQEQARTALK